MSADDTQQSATVGGLAMNPPLRLGLFAVALAVIFTVALATSAAITPGSATPLAAPPQPGPTGGTPTTGTDAMGLGLAHDGYRLTAVHAPAPARPVHQSTVDGYTIRAEGTLDAGSASTLTLVVTRDGQPVTRLEPHLGAFGHLVALRDGDLAYLHVHPHGRPQAAGDRSGPRIVFEVTAPTPGRYLLYLTFQVGGRVHTAPLVLEATSTTTEPGGGGPTQSTPGGDEHGGGHGD